MSRSAANSSAIARASLGLPIDLLVWQDVPAARLSAQQLQSLETWLTMGGSLVVIGGLLLAVAAVLASIEIDVTIELREDGSFHVTERDRIEFNGGPFRSGFFDLVHRCIIEVHLAHDCPYAVHQGW